MLIGSALVSQTILNVETNSNTKFSKFFIRRRVYLWTIRGRVYRKNCELRYKNVRAAWHVSDMGPTPVPDGTRARPGYPAPRIMLNRVGTILAERPACIMLNGTLLAVAGIVPIRARWVYRHRITRSALLAQYLHGTQCYTYNHEVCCIMSCRALCGLSKMRASLASFHFVQCDCALCQVTHYASRARTMPIVGIVRSIYYGPSTKGMGCEPCAATQAVSCRCFLRVGRRAIFRVSCAFLISHQFKRSRTDSQGEA